MRNSLLIGSDVVNSPDRLEFYDTPNHGSWFNTPRQQLSQNAYGQRRADGGGTCEMGSTSQCTANQCSLDVYTGGGRENSNNATGQMKVDRTLGDDCLPGLALGGLHIPLRVSVDELSSLAEYRLMCW